jgi:prepilin-type N-terminal cleavage/methylation domain-containing protein
MKAFLSNKRERGLTLVEVLVVLVVIAVFACLLLQPSLAGNKPHPFRISCVNNLKQIGMANSVWENDHGNKYPLNVSETNGGTMEFSSGPNEWRHFQVMSNELSTPNILFCSSDKARVAATNFTFLRNSNLSYFIDLDATATDPQTILTGDHNITNGTSIKNGILEVSSNQPSGWTAEMHKKVGNILLSDGSVQMISGSGLRSAIENSGGFTNRLQMPILSQ